MTAHIIAIEGIDQSGKQTQADLLASQLKKHHYKTTTISFPIYTTPAGNQIRRYLNGLTSYPAEAIHMLYSLNRWENKDKILRLASKHEFIIADRYTPSNLAYGTTRGLDQKWLSQLDKGLPTPNIVIVLDTPTPTSFARKTRGRDVHERDRQFLSKVRRNYRTLARRNRWIVLDGSRPVDTVRLEIWKIVRKKFKLDSRRRT
jgi:dTMP kinase